MHASIRIRPILSMAIAISLLLGLSACGNNNAPAGSAGPSRPAATTSAAKKTVSAPASSSTHAQSQNPAQARIEAMGVNDLLAAGNTAINQQRLVAPAGDNAFEYYEKALEKDSRNQPAQDALREQFPFGANAVEQTIGQNNFDEAQREIGLLTKADPGNYTLKILNSKLDAAKAQQQRLTDQKTKQAAALAARQAAEVKAASAPPPLPPPPVVQQTQPAPAPVQAPVKATPPPAPKPASETRGAQVVSMAQPEYPLQAARNSQSGSVTVGFSVDPDGSVSNVHVLSSSGHVFEAPAMQAVSRSKYKPALKDGQPVSSVLQRRMDFSLGG